MTPWGPWCRRLPGVCARVLCVQDCAVKPSWLARRSRRCPAHADPVTAAVIKVSPSSERRVRGGSSSPVRAFPLVTTQQGAETACRSSAVAPHCPSAWRGSPRPVSSWLCPSCLAGPRAPSLAPDSRETRQVRTPACPPGLRPLALALLAGPSAWGSSPAGV